MRSDDKGPATQLGGGDPEETVIAGTWDHGQMRGQNSEEGKLTGGQRGHTAAKTAAGTS